MAVAELPCIVKLRIWPHDVKDPCALVEAEKCPLTIPHAVVCSEMVFIFTLWEIFSSLCLACVLSHLEADPGLQGQVHNKITVAATSPWHPISAHEVLYEFRIYSLEEATFGSVLASQAVRAAH